MGCDTYYSDDIAVKFSEADDEWSCLCTFPHNYEGEEMTADVVRSLAALGAAMVLIRQDRMRDDYCYIPQSIPAWILDGINRLVPDDQTMTCKGKSQRPSR